MNRAATLAITSSYPEVRRAAEWLRAQCGPVLGEDRTDDFELAVVEAVTNIVRHAYAEQPGQPIALELSMSDRRAELLIRDRGRPPPYDLLAHPDPDDPMDESGRGMMIIRACVSHASVERIGQETVMRLVIDLPPQDAVA